MYYIYNTCWSNLTGCLTVQYPSSSTLMLLIVGSGVGNLGLGLRLSDVGGFCSLTFSLSATFRLVDLGVGSGFLRLCTLNLLSVIVLCGRNCGCIGAVLLMITSEPVVHVVLSVLVEANRFSRELSGVTSGVSYGCAPVTC